MASTILQQVLVNVESGTLLPRSEPVRVPDIDPLAGVQENTLARLDHELDRSVDRAFQLISSLELSAAEQHRAVAQFAEILQREFDSMGGHSSAPSLNLDPDLDVLRNLISQLEQLPAPAAAEAPQTGGSLQEVEILTRLEQLSRQIREIPRAQPSGSDHYRSAEVTRPSESRSESPPPDPEPHPTTRVPLDDIQNMIEFLK